MSGVKGAHSAVLDDFVCLQVKILAVDKHSSDNKYHQDKECACL